MEEEELCAGPIGVLLADNGGCACFLVSWLEVTADGGVIQGGTLISGSFTFGGWHTMNTGNHKEKMGETQEENTQSTRKQSHKC